MDPCKTNPLDYGQKRPQLILSFSEAVKSAGRLAHTYPSNVKSSSEALWTTPLWTHRDASAQQQSGIPPRAFYLSRRSLLQALIASHRTKRHEV